MTPKEMVTQFRELAHDRVQPFRWSDVSLLLYLNEGRTEAARRARLIEDGDTAETCKITVKVDKLTYDVDKRVMYIRRVKLASQDLPLPKLSIADADMQAPGWEDADAGTPRVWVPWGSHKLRLIDKPDTNDTLHLYVVREPLAPLTLASTEDDVELDARLHFKLIDWMQFRAYMERDVAEKYRPDEARDRLAMFEQEFGPASNAALESWIHRKHGYDDFEGLY